MRSVVALRTSARRMRHWFKDQFFWSMFLLFWEQDWGVSFSLSLVGVRVRELVNIHSVRTFFTPSSLTSFTAWSILPHLWQVRCRCLAASSFFSRLDCDLIERRHAASFIACSRDRMLGASSGDGVGLQSNGFIFLLSLEALLSVVLRNCGRCEVRLNLRRALGVIVVLGAG
jgi:hypothetical protein